MARRAGSADLPLHGGRVPSWLADRMTRLGAVISEAIIHTYGRDELLRRLAHPFWFQSFGAVMGMDWHSSGITTSVIGALKRGLEPLSGELGIHVCGGRGKHSRKTLTRRVRRGDRDIRLGSTDFRLLECLLERPGRVFSRAQLLDLVWGRSVEVDERTVDVHIGRLRRRLSKGKERDPIRTVRGAGYALDESFGRSDRR